MQRRKFIETLVGAAVATAIANKFAPAAPEDDLTMTFIGLPDGPAIPSCLSTWQEQLEAMKAEMLKSIDLINSQPSCISAFEPRPRYAYTTSKGMKMMGEGTPSA